MINIIERKKWFRKYDVIYSMPDISPGFNCRSICNAACCPHPQMGSNQIGHFVIFLPFELEYIREHINKNLSHIGCFQFLKHSNSAWAKICPFIDHGKCSIYKYRPIDCRSFPLLATKDYATLRFEVNKSCPGAPNLSNEFNSHVLQIWEKVYPIIPISWWTLLGYVEKNTDVDI